jgi:hypothetical protein
MRISFGIFLAVALTGVLAGQTHAGPVADQATSIEAKLSEGDGAGAISLAQDLLADVWGQTLDVSFTQALLVAEQATGYGVYNPRATNIFKMGEPILIYCEPVGFDYGNPGEGLWSVNFFIDLQVLDSGGNQLANLPEVTQYNMVSRHLNREIPANITYTLQGIKAGRYTLVTTLRDKNSQKSGSFQTAIEIAE